MFASKKYKERKSNWGKYHLVQAGIYHGQRKLWHLRRGIAVDMMRGGEGFLALMKQGERASVGAPFIGQGSVQVRAAAAAKSGNRGFSGEEIPGFNALFNGEMRCRGKRRIRSAEIWGEGEVGRGWGVGWGAPCACVHVYGR